MKYTTVAYWWDEWSDGALCSVLHSPQRSRCPACTVASGPVYPLTASGLTKRLPQQFTSVFSTNHTVTKVGSERWCSESSIFPGKREFHINLNSQSNLALIQWSLRKSCLCSHGPPPWSGLHITSPSCLRYRLLWVCFIDDFFHLEGKHFTVERHQCHQCKRGSF